MRKLLFSFGIFGLALMFLASCSNQQKPGYTIAININNLRPATKVILQKRETGNWVKIDSVTLKNGKGSLSGEVKSPQLYYLAFKRFNLFMPIWVGNSHITVKAALNTLRNPVIKGSKAQDQFNAFRDSTKRFVEKERALGQQYGEALLKKDKNKLKQIEAQYNKSKKQRLNYILGYVVRHNKSVISPYIIMSNSFALSLNQLDSVTNQFNSTLAQNVYVKFLKNRVKILKRVAIGQPYVNFTLNNPKGKPISLSSVVKKHKYTLLDFWASWCLPCREENPNIVAAFNKYKSKGFTVFGVSFDRNHDSWVKAIKTDGLDWTQVSDLKYWNSTAAKLYGVQSIPHNVLIGPNGKIVAQNLRGAKLQDTLKTLLK